jgi:hypothetical protein
LESCRSSSEGGGSGFDYYGRVRALKQYCKEWREKADTLSLEPLQTSNDGPISRWTGLLLFQTTLAQYALAKGKLDEARDPTRRLWQAYQYNLLTGHKPSTQACLELLGYQCDECWLPGMTPGICSVCKRGLDVMKGFVATPAYPTAPTGYDAAKKALRADPAFHSMTDPQFLVAFKHKHPGPFSVHAEALKARQATIANAKAKSEAGGAVTKDQLWRYLGTHQEAVLPREVTGRFSDEENGGSSM